MHSLLYTPHLSSIANVWCLLCFSLAKFHLPAPKDGHILVFLVVFEGVGYEISSGVPVALFGLKFSSSLPSGKESVLGFVELFHGSTMTSKTTPFPHLLWSPPWKQQTDRGLTYRKVLRDCSTLGPYVSI